MAVRFVGRAAELNALDRFLAKPEPAIAVIYGRRRIGKSLLIQQALAGRSALTFEGLENRGAGGLLLPDCQGTRTPGRGCSGDTVASVG